MPLAISKPPIKPNPFLIDVLLEKRVINDDHHFYGVQMISLRRVFLDPVRTKIGMLRVKTDDEASPEKPIIIEDTDYLKVRRAIRNPEWQAIIGMVCDEEADLSILPLLRLHQGKVTMAFGSLTDAIISLWEKKRCKVECGEICVGICK